MANRSPSSPAAARDDDTGAGITDARQLRDQATTLDIAGSETTGNTIAWACYLLGQVLTAGIQERLQQEADPALAIDDPATSS